MRRWFLSYHSPDQALAERLKAAIERKDKDSCVFFAPTKLRAGGFWSRALAEEIAQADAFVLLVGEKGVGNWQVLEYDEALDRRVKAPDFPLVLMLLEGQTAPGLPFLRRLHWIVTPDPASEKNVARLIDATSGSGTRPAELWRYTSPYRGLAAMEEKDSDYFFGRERETVEVIKTLAAAPDRLPILLGNSGVGKSSLAQAGVLAALKRQGWPEGANAPNAWPQIFQDSRKWCFLSLKPGTDPLRALVGSFFDTWQFAATDPERVKQQNGWIELLGDGKATLRDLLDATERRYDELDQIKPSAFFLYVDQGEELYVRAEERQRRRFSEVLAHAMPDPRLRAMMSIRSDFLGGLQCDEPLFNARQQIDVPPLREAELRNVVNRPAELLSVRFETSGLADIITRRTAEDSVKDVGALPLLSYTLDDMWTQMVESGEAVLRLPAQSFEIGGVLVNRANAFLATHPGAEDALRRVLTLRLATVREDGEPTRRRALRSEFSDVEWRLVSELADHPNRLVVTVTPNDGEPYAEVAHEAVFRRWETLRDWIAAEREFLAWRTGLEAARRSWEAAPTSSKIGALLMGLALAQARDWLAKPATDLSETDKSFIALSIARERAARRRALGARALVAGLFAGAFAAVAWLTYTERLHPSYLRAHFLDLADKAGPKLQTGSAERPLNTYQIFQECWLCPEMVVVPAGEFTMGVVPAGEFTMRDAKQRTIKIGYRLAVSRFEVTFNEWDACVELGGCPAAPDYGNWGRGNRPVIQVSWGDAKKYVKWLNRRIGSHRDDQPYRLLSEAEWEYVARARSTSAFAWGPEIQKDEKPMANCKGCGSQWDDKQTAPVGSFAPNNFGLYDMAGNVWEWVEDCYVDTYDGAPTDGSARTDGDCGSRVLRGGSWSGNPGYIRSAARLRLDPGVRLNFIGLRLGRVLTP
jgi:formylglycine-generating enzyme required for sulfatase activity